MPASLVQLDDARAAVTYDRMVPPASFADYRKWVALHVEVLNHALEGIPEDRVRYHVCWGSWPGPHTTDVPLQGHRRSHPQGARRRLRDRGRQSAPRARMEGVGEREAAGRQGAHPRRHQPRDQHRRASRAGGRAHRAARASSSAARTSSPAPIAASRKARSTAACIPRSCGRSSKRSPQARGSRRWSCGDRRGIGEIAGAIAYKRAAQRGRPRRFTSLP